MITLNDLALPYETIVIDFLAGAQAQPKHTVSICAIDISISTSCLLTIKAAFKKLKISVAALDM